MGLVDDQDGNASPLCVLGGERVGGLRDEGGAVGLGDAAEAGDDGLVDAGDPDRRVGDVDDGVSGVVECVEGGPDRDCFPGADLAGDHAEAAFADAPGDAGRGRGMGGVAVQHPGGQVFAERHGRETVVALDLVYQLASSQVVDEVVE